MNSPFILNSGKINHTITWPSFRNINGNPACYNLLKLLFEDMRMDYVVLLLSDEQMITINASLWFSNHGQAYSDWLMSQYSILGVSFKEINKAKYLQDYLEKKYMWKLLKA
jgi:hypothetical protein